MFNFANYLHDNNNFKFYKSIILFYDINQFVKKYNKLYIFFNNR